MWEPQALHYVDGSVSAPGRLAPPYGLARIIVFIHGYNNDRQQARESYDALMEKLALADQGVVWQLYWPGFVERLTGSATETPLSLAPRYDERGTESNVLLSIPSYHAQVLKAPSVGRALGGFLEQTQPRSVVFVAHSLGCRVTLEAIRFLTRANRVGTVSIRGVCLMAAAVPTYMLEAARAHWYARSPQGGEFNGSVTMIRRSLVLHSTRDRVLQRAFPLGQMRAGEGVLPEAVGRHGRPNAAWSVRGQTYLGHSGYWTSPVSVTATRHVIGRVIASQLPTLQGPQNVAWQLAVRPALVRRSLRTRTWQQTAQRPTITEH
jgi:pimeloyl-ACP methyl ester carboxylesterase